MADKKHIAPAAAVATAPEITTDHAAHGCIDEDAAWGDIAQVKRLHDAGGVCTTAAMDMAATNGHIEVVIWLHMNRKEGCTTAAMDGAFANSHFGIFRWLHINRTEGYTQATIAAAEAKGDAGWAAWLRAQYKINEQKVSLDVLVAPPKKDCACFRMTDTAALEGIVAKYVESVLLDHMAVDKRYYNVAAIAKATVVSKEFATLFHLLGAAPRRDSLLSAFTASDLCAKRETIHKVFEVSARVAYVVGAEPWHFVPFLRDTINGVANGVNKEDLVMLREMRTDALLQPSCNTVFEEELVAAALRFSHT